MMLIASFPGLSKKYCGSPIPTWIFHFLQVAVHRIDERTYSRIPWRVLIEPILPTLLAFHFQLTTRGGGADGGTGHVGRSRSGVPSGGGGALLLTHSSTALNGALCGMGLFLTASGTALTCGLSTLVLALFDWPLPLRFSKEEESSTHSNLSERSETERGKISLARSIDAVKSKTQTRTPTVTSRSLTQCSASQNGTAPPL